jgi:hypothetical protein
MPRQRTNRSERRLFFMRMIESEPEKGFDENIIIEAFDAGTELSV